MLQCDAVVGQRNLNVVQKSQSLSAFKSVRAHLADFQFESVYIQSADLENMSTFVVSG